jgi:hypothetical protein
VTERQHRRGRRFPGNKRRRQEPSLFSAGPRLAGAIRRVKRNPETREQLVGNYILDTGGEKLMGGEPGNLTAPGKKSAQQESFSPYNLFIFMGLKNMNFKISRSARAKQPGQ